MISEKEINLWLSNNRMCVIPISELDRVASRLGDLERERMRNLESTAAVRAGNKALRVGKLVEEIKLLKKNLKRLRQTLGVLRTGEGKRLRSLLARQRNWNSNTQAQTA